MVNQLMPTSGRLQQVRDNKAIIIIAAIGTALGDWQIESHKI